MLATFQIDLAQFAGRLRGIEVPLLVQMRFPQSKVTSRLQGSVSVTGTLAVNFGWGGVCPLLACCHWMIMCCLISIILHHQLTLTHPIGKWELHILQQQL